MSKILIYILISCHDDGRVFALVRYLESIGVFFPSRNMAVNPSVMGLPWEDVYFKTKDNVTLNGWFFKNPHAQGPRSFLPMAMPAI
jgi:hypothetical protein